MMIPHPVISISIVMKMKPIAACFLFDAIKIGYLKANKQKIHLVLDETDFFIFRFYSDYNSNALLASPFINNSTGFSNASLTATKKPTDSRPSIILWS